MTLKAKINILGWNATIYIARLPAANGLHLCAAGAPAGALSLGRQDIEPGGMLIAQPLMLNRRMRRAVKAAQPAGRSYFLTAHFQNNSSTLKALLPL